MDGVDQVGSLQQPVGAGRYLVVEAGWVVTRPHGEVDQVGDEV